MLKKFLLLQNLLYNIDVKNARYIISDIIYPDGLTEQQFFTTIRKVFNASLYLNITLNEMILGKGQSQLANRDAGDFVMTPGDSMFT